MERGTEDQLRKTGWADGERYRARTSSEGAAAA